MRQYDGENAIVLQVMKFVKQECIVGLGLWRKPILGETRVHLLVGGVPVLGIGWVADHGIHSKWHVDFGAFLVYGPVVFKGVGTAGDNVLRNYASHHKVHTGEVVGVLLQLLRIIFHLVLALDVLAHSLADSDQQRTRAGSGVVNFKRLFIFVVLCHNLRHHHCHLMGSVEFTSLLACVGSEVADKKFIHIAQHIIVL